MTGSTSAASGAGGTEDFVSKVALQWRAEEAVETLVSRLRDDMADRFGCDFDVEDRLSDMIVQPDAAKLAEQAAAYRADPQVRSVHDSGPQEEPWMAAARWNPLTGDMAVGYLDPEAGWCEHVCWRVVNDTGAPWPDAAAAEAAAAETLQDKITAMGKKLIEDSYAFDDLIERWIELGLDRHKLQEAIEYACSDLGTYIEEFVLDRVEVSFQPASENVMFSNGFEKALKWWRSSGLGPQEAFDCLDKPVYEVKEPVFAPEPEPPVVEL